MYCILLATSNSACSLFWCMLLFLIKITFFSSEDFKEGVNAHIRSWKFTHVIKQKILGMSV